MTHIIVEGVICVVVGFLCFGAGMMYVASKIQVWR